MEQYWDTSTARVSLAKYLIPGCVGRGLDLDLRVREAAPAASGVLGFFKTQSALRALKIGPGQIWDFTKSVCLRDFVKWDP